MNSKEKNIGMFFQIFHKKMELSWLSIIDRDLLLEDVDVTGILLDPLLKLQPKFILDFGNQAIELKYVLSTMDTRDTIRLEETIQADSFIDVKFCLKALIKEVTKTIIEIDEEEKLVEEK